MNHSAILMHKDVEVIKFLMNNDGLCTQIVDIMNEDHLPPSMQPLDTVFEVNRWLSERRLSEERSDVKALRSLKNLQERFFMPLHYLSIYDCYWIKYDGEASDWRMVTLYTMPMRDDIFMIFEEIDEDPEFCRDTANMTIPGNREILAFMNDESQFYFSLQITEKDRNAYLQNIYQQIMPTIRGEYHLTGTTLTYDFENVTHEDLEYIPYDSLFNAYKEQAANRDKENEVLFFESLEYYQIPDAIDFVTKMIALDSQYKVPRDLCDFGVLRDPNSLEIKGFCPIFIFPDKVA